ncbi:MAG: hypothetical protein WCC64_01855 [Aliidongia sp.]
MTNKINQATRATEAASFEVQIFIAGKWTTELVLADRDEAEAEAERILESGRRPLGVCVIHEAVDPRTGLITATTIFRRTREDENRAAERQEKLKQTKAKIAEIRVGQREERARAARQEVMTVVDATQRAKKRRAPRRLHWLWFLILLTALLAAGLLVLLKLHAMLFN